LIFGREVSCSCSLTTDSECAVRNSFMR
jgi:hypothetical protein